MVCSKIPDHVREKVDGVRKELGLVKLNKVMRVAGELSWNGWDEDAVVNKLSAEFAMVEKQGRTAPKVRLNQIVWSLTKNLKGLNYNFPPREKLSSSDMWYAEDVIGQARIQRCLKRNRTPDQPSTCATEKQSEIAPQMASPTSRITRSRTRDKINLMAQNIARREVFRQTNRCRRDQDLVKIIRRVIDKSSDKDDTPEDMVVSRVEAHLQAASSSDELNDSYSSSDEALAESSSGLGLDKSSASSSIFEIVGSIGEGEIIEESSDEMMEDPGPRSVTSVPSNGVPSNEVRRTSFTTAETSGVATESTIPTVLPVEPPSIPVSWRANQGETVVPYDSYDAQVTANLLALVSNAAIDWSIVSCTFSGLVLHALRLRASRLTAYYYEKCAQAGRRIANMGPTPQSRDLTLQEDRVTLSDVLATFEPSHQSVMGVYQRLQTLIEELPSLQESMPSMIYKPIMVYWDLPSSLPVFERLNRQTDWRFFQSCIEACRTQLHQAPNSLETVEMLEGMPKFIDTRSPTIVKHPQVRDWLDAICRLADAMRSKEAKKAEVEVTMQQFKDCERKSMEALQEIESRLTELWQCDYKLGLLRAHSESRANAILARNQQLIERRESLRKELQEIDVRIAQGEYDMLQDYEFGAKKCLPPWSLAEMMTLLEPKVRQLIEFLQQGHGCENLGDMLRMRVDDNIKLLSEMVCNSQAIEQLDGCSASSSSLPKSRRVSTDYVLENCETSAAHGSKKQRHD